MKNKIYFIGVVWMVCSLFGCAEKKPEPKEAPVQNNLITDASTTEMYLVKFVTSKGEFVMEVHPEWAPIAATQFHKLVEAKFYDDCYFFRVIDNFMAQTGVNGNPQVHQKWSGKNLQDEKIRQDNKRSFVSFAQANYPNTRSTQFFINYRDNSLAAFAPFGKVISGMEVVDSFYSGYDSTQIDQQAISLQGNNYLKQNYPKLDHIISARIVETEKKVEEKKE